MPRTSSLRSAVILQWPASFKVTLQIDPDRIDSDATVGTVAVRLVNMGGKFVAWKPHFDRRPAVAQFEFSSSEARARFIGEALAISGVSLASHR